MKEVLYPDMKETCIKKIKHVLHLQCFFSLIIIFFDNYVEIRVCCHLSSTLSFLSLMLAIINIMKFLVW